LVPLTSLDPLPQEDVEPWNKALRGKRVLVVHPFRRSIEAQYPLRRQILPDDLLPTFQLTCMEAVQSSCRALTPFDSWFDALASMTEQVVESDAEIVLIGAGAYGLPLAAAAKRSGKVGFHVGGALQLLFGILGGRWADRPDVQSLKTDAWVRPSVSERPPGAEILEKACYW
jgi:hypothetical protein